MPVLFLRAPPALITQVVSWLVTSSGECRGDRASAVRLGQDMVSHRLLKPLCAGYDRPENAGAAGGAGGGWGDVVGKSGGKNEGGEQRSLFRSFDDAVGWLFAYAGDALRDPFAPPPPTQIAVMTRTRLDVRVTDWIEVRFPEWAVVGVWFSLFFARFGWPHDLLGTVRYARGAGGGGSASTFWLVLGGSGRPQRVAHHLPTHQSTHPPTHDDLFRPQPPAFPGNRPRTTKART